MHRVSSSRQHTLLLPTLTTLTTAALLIAPAAHAQINNNVSPAMAAALGWVDVSKPPYNAIPNDGVDDTAALQRAISENVQMARGDRVLYLPNGTYNLSDALRSHGTDKRWHPNLKLHGESRTGTILKLKNNCAGFNRVSAPQAVIVQASGNAGFYPTTSGGGNDSFGNVVADLTIDVGSGNPGAGGIDLMANNGGGILNVTIKSSDANRLGYAGIMVTTPTPKGAGFLQNAWGYPLR